VNLTVVDSVDKLVACENTVLEKGNNMPELELLQVFVRVCELNSFSRAAETLGMSKARVSGAVQKLENMLGTQLLQRTTRRVQPTHDGLQCYQRSLDLLADVDELQHLFQRQPAELSGRLRVDMPTGVARNMVVPHLREFLKQHPRLAIELSSTDRRVDVIREGFDCVVRVGTLADSSLIARKLGNFAIVNCASPSYLAEFGVPKTLADLAQHRLIHYQPNFGSAPEGFEYRADNGEYQTVELPGALVVNNSEAYQAACLAGLGIIQAPLAGVRPLIEQGLLVTVLQQLQAEPMPVHILYPQRRNLSRRVRVFMDWLDALLRPQLVA
jgi:DNA-binding transcriptional LysR family regulator